MGKSGKKQKKKQERRSRRDFKINDSDDGGEDGLGESINLPSEEDEEENEETEDDEEEVVEDESVEKGRTDCPSKFHLYQESVQSPKGDISYLQKFFLMYVGGRTPLHLQEDFCGTALLSTEWLRSDPRRTAVGVDLDLEALTWCFENNINKIGADACSRISLFHGNVLQPMEAKLVKYDLQDLVKNATINESKGCLDSAPEDTTKAQCSDSAGNELTENSPLPARDIVCAFNYSCCCLQKRKDLILYFEHVHRALSRKGGIFVMDVYGGTSSEQKLRLQRKFPNFTYVWEQAEFDIIRRTTRISLHFKLHKQQWKLRHAFSYSWRLWSLPEIKDCLEEAGFQSVHFWIRRMPDTREMKNSIGLSAGRNVKYEELSTFQQQDAWNAYVVGVAK
ncbi:hypothetical protein Sjap_001190 [Stephania japonica]|uniref:S-adenosyl-L-methionine-dependent methyltransferases superfamily protein n=1 Tax=Stephania japonica TaxID=461633 RepID=A0AAP0KKE3_9MAGN